MFGNFWKIVDEAAATMQPTDEQSVDAAFHLSKRPLVPRESQGRLSPRSSRDYENLGELPRSYGRPVLFGIARDPHTLFVYWEIDWHKAFGNKPPSDRKVYMRVLANGAGEETRVTVEPLAGNHSLSVSQASSIYRIELGYEEPGGTWNSVIESDVIATPPDEVSDSSDIDVATVPFHLSFQRLIDTFQAAKPEGEALVDFVGRLQKCADASAETDLTDSDRDLLRAIDCTLSAGDAAQRSRLRKSSNGFATRKRIESVLGFGGSSRM